MDAEAIAKGLSAAQKRLVLWLDGEQFKDWLANGEPTGNRRTRTAVAWLTEYQINGPVSLYFMRRLNENGLAVRAILKGES